MTSILNHSAPIGLHASILQNHEEKPDSDGQNSSTDAPHEPTRAALVANVITATFQFCPNLRHASQGIHDLESFVPLDSATHITHNPPFLSL